MSVFVLWCFFLGQKNSTSTKCPTLVATSIDVSSVVINDEHQTTMDYCLLAAGACTEVHYSREGLQGWGLKYIIFFWTKKKTWKPSASTIIATILGLLGVVINDEHQTTVDYCSLAARACTEVGLSRVWVVGGVVAQVWGWTQWKMTKNVHLPKFIEE
jgi:hypothetical protein